MRRDSGWMVFSIALLCLWAGPALAQAPSRAPDTGFNWFSSVGIVTTLLLGVAGFFRTIEQNKDGSFRDLATRLCDGASSVIRAAAAGQLPDYFHYRRYYLGKRPYASQVLHLLLHSLKKDDDLDVRQVLFNSLVAITGKTTLKAVAQGAGTDLGRGLDLIRAKLDQVIMDGFDFSGIDLTEASMVRCSAIGAKFKGANLWKTIIMHSNLQNADFTNAKLWDATLEHLDLRNAKLLTEHVNRNTALRYLNVEGAERSPQIDERMAAG